jgi:hypothetical protein
VRATLRNVQVGAQGFYRFWRALHSAWNKAEATRVFQIF